DFFKNIPANMSDERIMGLLFEDHLLFSPVYTRSHKENSQTQFAVFQDEGPEQDTNLKFLAKSLAEFSDLLLHIFPKHKFDADYLEKCHSFPESVEDQMALFNELHKDFSDYESKEFKWLRNLLLSNTVKKAVFTCFSPIFFEKEQFEDALTAKELALRSHLLARDYFQLILLEDDYLESTEKAQTQLKKQAELYSLYALLKASPLYTKKKEEKFIHMLKQHPEIQIKGKKFKGTDVFEFLLTVTDNHRISLLKGMIINLLKKYPTPEQLEAAKLEEEASKLTAAGKRSRDLLNLEAEILASPLFLDLIDYVPSIRGFIDSGDMKNADVYLKDLRMRMDKRMNLKESAKDVVNIVSEELAKIKLDWVEESKKELLKKLEEKKKKLLQLKHPADFVRIIEKIDAFYFLAGGLLRLQKKYNKLGAAAKSAPPAYISPLVLGTDKVKGSGSSPALKKICSALAEKDPDKLSEMLSMLLFSLKNHNMYGPTEFRRMIGLVMKRATGELSSKESSELDALVSEMFNLSQQKSGANDRTIELREAKIETLVKELYPYVGKLNRTRIAKISFFENMRGVLQMLKNTKLSEGEEQAKVLAEGKQVRVKDLHAWKTFMARYRRAFKNELAPDGLLHNLSLQFKDEKSRAVFENALDLYFMLKDAGYDKFG
ncbi:MAG: hypothetical protein ABIF92_02935, partial [archaeon]